MAAPTANYARACTNFNINLDGTFSAFNATAVSITVNRGCRLIDACQITSVAAGGAGNNTVAAAGNSIFTLDANTAAATLTRAASCTSFANALVASGASITFTAFNATCRHLVTLTLIGNSIP